jgi:uncharacterized membrane protein
MTKNMGTVDRSIRILAAIVIAVLYLNGTISGLLGAILGIVALMFFVTSVLGYCPAYVPLKISTCKKTS